jgi:uncharacterized protein (DUF2062 family)
MAFMGAVVVVFFGQVDTRLLLSLTVVGMVLFYGGWFCVRQASRRRKRHEKARKERRKTALMKAGKWPLTPIKT